MGRRSSSSFLPGRLEKNLILSGLCVCLAMGGCASQQPGKPVHERWPASGADATVPYLLALREYLALPAGDQAAHRKQLQQAAAANDSSAELEYALALSVDRDDRASLEQARKHFEKLLAAPDPLPVALDALVRLQLGQAIDRLQRMQESGEIHGAYRAAASESRTCSADLEQRNAELEQMRGELLDVQRKLDALAEIEQTVSEQDESPDDRQDEPPDMREPRSQ